MSAQVEARRLSGVDIGKTVEVDGCALGRVTLIEHREDHAVIELDGDPAGFRLAPTDLVTITGRPAEATGVSHG